VHRTDRGEGDDFTRILKRLDGSKIFSLILWKLPEGKSLDDTSPKRDANEYMQVAGSADRMTVEVRRIRAGNVEHYVVGHSPNGAEQGQTETIHWDSVDTIVAPNEVFSAAESARLFDTYYRTDWVPSDYVLRPIVT
jgi:hypothetical protein